MNHDGPNGRVMELSLPAGASGVRIEVAVRPAVRGESVAGPAGPEAVEIDRDYSRRAGYDPSFIPGLSVPMPALSREQQRIAAGLIAPAPGADPHELKYQHFSVVMNRLRRMAFFTAVNIDGAKLWQVDRDTGEPVRREAMEAAEAREVWYDDPRIGADAQCEQSLYDRQSPRVFDRGHLVRRTEPNWGSRATVRRANADTFHFTNCTPQQGGFNRSARHWAGIEDYVRNNSRDDDVRICVFCGPVFRDNDPRYRYVKVPMEFWKIVVRVSGGRLVSTALLASQKKHLRRMPESFAESFDEDRVLDEFQAPVGGIARLTGLTFARAIVEGDTYRGGGEGVFLRSFGDLRLEPASED
jgi:endonuclease G